MRTIPSSTALSLVAAVALSVIMGMQNGLFSPLTAQYGGYQPNLGNGVCDPGESYYINKEEGCPNPCGDGYCDNREVVENAEYSCPKDCNTKCGDGTCDAAEKNSNTYCGMDCGDVCGDGIFGMTEICEDGNKLDGDGCNKDCKYECGDGVRDTDASDGYSEVCDGEFGCVNACQFMEIPGIAAAMPVKPYCKPYDPEFNDIDADRVNLVFVGSGLAGTGDLLKAMDRASQDLLSIEPFASSKEKIQFWYAPDIDAIKPGKDDWKTTCDQSCASDIQCPELDQQFRSIICNRECRSRALFDGPPSVVSYPNLVEYYDRVFSHEFGHQFGRLADEYSEKGIGQFPNKPNCAPTIEKAYEWWKAFAGTEDPTAGTVAYYKGCSYEGNYRPTNGQGSVMFDGGYFSVFGPVNESWLKQKLATYSGYSPRGTTLSKKEDATPSDTAFWSGETAYRMTLRRQEDGTYVPVGGAVIEAPYGVKPSMQSDMAVTVTIDGKEYTQTFSTSITGFAESFSGSVIQVGPVTREPRQEITVDIGLGTTPPSIAADAIRPVIKPCNDNDEDDSNDCPPPMYRGRAMKMTVSSRSSQAFVAPSSLPSVIAAGSSESSYESASSVSSLAISSSVSSFAISSAVSSAGSSESSLESDGVLHTSAPGKGPGIMTILSIAALGLALGSLVMALMLRRRS